ncbi:RNA pyrophosphohydrolase [Poseidonocella sedimentorum]|uniref:RNA pyrophosphohydrolase n=1 Tax=Poseidonocella sedimentorum TaxID=871652 RepID=A0A1I6CPX8_9RHOB|nr:RNA pyrophosphohydrolase [Poseidonocella sedimentorum]SFQ95213.1 putative (di)nucleoside polyphosphate hydrolase [Poseidonocella sedimentorum]
MTPEDIAQLPYRRCVGVMLINSDKRIFVGQRLDSDLPAWQMPQGGIDPGETPTDAALRELHEETGVGAEHVRIEAQTDETLKYDLPLELVPKVWKGRYRGQEQYWVLLRLEAPEDVIDIDTEHPEFSEWRWLDPQELLAQIVPFKRDVYRQVLDHFSDHLDPAPNGK